MLEIKNLCIEINGKLIIKNMSFVVDRNDKLAIIGEEGNGKSTLLKAIVNKCDYAKIEGSINLKNNSVGYLEQAITDSDLEKSSFEFLFDLKDDYYNKTNILYKYIRELKIDERILDNNSIKYLSGGEKVKLQLLKILLNNPDILFLDEPTNDLDIATLKWLENFINNESRPIIYVTHDETLLSNTANKILHLELTRKKTTPIYTFIKMGYDDYVDIRIRKISHTTKVANKEKSQYKKKEEHLLKIRDKVDSDLNSISRSQPHAAKMLKRKMQSIKAQEKRMANTDLVELPDVEEAINLVFDEVYVPTKKEILNIHIPELKIEEYLLCYDIDLEIIGNKHIVIIGDNGCGKTTLIERIYGVLKNRDDITVGYMPQDYNDILSDYVNPIDYIYGGSDIREISKIRSYMGNMNFTVNEMIGCTDHLSGGSRAKLMLLKLIYDKCNVLILDEPTRNLSPLSNPIIRLALKNFKGTIISVSHDRKYITEVIDDVYIMKDKKLFCYNKKTN